MTSLLPTYSPDQPDFRAWTSVMTLDFHPLFQGKIDPSESLVFMTGSSTIKDLQGDTMEASALQDMTAAHPHLSVWMNHDYELPGKLFGSLATAPIMTQQHGIADLHLAVDCELENPDARQVFLYIKRGRRLGCSGGFKVVEWEIEEAAEGNDLLSMLFAPLKILHVIPIEWSVVGIPAKQRSWVETAASGIFQRSLAEGKDEDARRLAPIIKSLFPRDYRAIVEQLGNHHLRKDLERIPERSVHPSRILWEPKRNLFTFMHGKKTYELAPEAVSILLEQGAPGLHQNVDEFLQKTATGKTSWPLADRDVEWDGNAAAADIFAWAKNDSEAGFEPAKVKQCFFYSDPEKQTIKEGYKLPFCKRVGREMHTIFAGVQAVAGVLQGARGGVKDIPEPEIATIKGKIETIYQRAAKQYNDPELAPPWKKEEKQMEETIHKASDELLLAADGSHTVHTGSHTHPHAAYQSQGNDQTHTHEHNHTNDNSHDHHGEPENKETMYNESGSLPPYGHKQKAGQNVASQAEVAESLPLDPMRESFFRMGEVLGYDMSLLLTASSTKGLTKAHMVHAQAIHDHIMGMTDGQVCEKTYGYTHPGGPGEGSLGKEGETTDEARQRAEQERETQMSWRNSLNTLTQVLKSFEGVDLKALQSEMIIIQTAAKTAHDDLRQLNLKAKTMQDQLAQLDQRAQQTTEAIDSLRVMPLGRPTTLQRQVQDAIGATSNYQEMRSAGKQIAQQTTHLSLYEALAQTRVIEREGKQAGQVFISRYREWPDSLVPEGGRPALTNDQRSLMTPLEVVAYEENRRACVPLIDDPEALLPAE